MGTGMVGIQPPDAANSPQLYLVLAAQLPVRQQQIPTALYQIPIAKIRTGGSLRHLLFSSAARSRATLPPLTTWFLAM